MDKQYPDDQILDVVLKGGPIRPVCDAFSLGGRWGIVVTSSRTPEVLKGWRLLAVDGQIIGTEIKNPGELVRLAQQKPLYLLTFFTGSTRPAKPRKVKQNQIECNSIEKGDPGSNSAAQKSALKEFAESEGERTCVEDAKLSLNDAILHSECDDGLNKTPLRDPSLLYEDVRHLGTGSFGAAFLVRHIESGKHLVAKKCSIAGMDELHRQACLDEISMLRRMQNVHVAHYVDFLWTGADRGMFWLLLKYYPNGDVQHYIDARREKHEHIEPQTVRKWFTELCLALEYVHSCLVVHCDVKGNNLLISEAQNIVLADFGVSKQLKPDTNKAPSLSGSPFYMAPERWDGGIASFASDMWSVGVVGYEMISLRRPFEGATLPSLVYKIGNQAPSPIPDGICFDLFRDLIMKLLNKIARERPSASEALQNPYISTCVELLETYHGLMEDMADKLRTLRDQAGLDDTPGDDLDASDTSDDELAPPVLPLHRLLSDSWKGACLIDSHCNTSLDSITGGCETP